MKILCSLCLSEISFIEKGDGVYILTNASCESCVDHQIELSYENQKLMSGRALKAQLECLNRTYAALESSKKGE